MNDKLILKIHLDSHEVVYVHVDKFPFSLGRSIRNSYIFDKPGISSSHLHLEQKDDGIYLSDQNSTNGIYHNGERIDGMKIEKNVSLYIASYKVDFLWQDEGLEKTQELQLPELFVKEGFRKKIILKTLGGFLFILVPAIFKIFLTDPLTVNNYVDYLKEIGAMALIAVILSASASIFSKIHCRKYQLFSFMWYVNMWMGLACLATFMPNILYFYLDLYRIKSFLDLVVPTFLLGLLVFIISNILFQKVLKRKIVLVISSVVVAGALIKAAISFYNDGFGDYDFQGALAYPLGTYSQKEYPMEELIREYDKKVKIVDRYREKALVKRQEEKKEDS